MNRVLKGLTVGLLFGLAVAAVAGAKGPAGPRLAKLSTDRKIDINNVAMFVTNEGSFSYDLTTRSSGLEFPKGTGKTPVYASGIWVGGKVGGDLRVALGEYQYEWQPGPIGKDGKSTNPDDPKYTVYKISRGDNAATNPDYANWPVADGAPAGKDGKPLILGDQTLWCVYNDANDAKHTYMQTKALGLEVQQTIFAFDRTGALGNVIFARFLIINKGGNKIDSTFVSVWSDPDLGQADNDLVGTDVGLSLGYCYNATNSDAVYGATPPAVGFDFFKGPLGPDKKPLPMTSFNKYINGTDPRTALQVYNYMLGKDNQGKDVVDPTTNRVTLFSVAGDPVTGTGWLDTNPADRRLMMNSGPFTMAPGDTQEVVVGIVLGQGKDRLTSITALKFNDSFAQAAFDANFQLPSPPTAPKVAVSPLEGRVALTWGDDSEKGGDPRYQFEGYNVYQGESVAGPWKRIATYDLVNGAAIVFDNEFDENAGVVINRPVQFGGDTGIRHYIELADDAIRGGKLVNGQTYYYTVTAYSYGANQSPKTLETSLTPLRDGRLVRKPLSEEFEPANGIIPRWPTAGSDFKVVKTDSAVTHKSGRSDGRVYVKVVNPAKVTGSAYQVKFKEDAEANVFWDLVDATKNATVLKDMAQNESEAQGDANPIVDGLLVKVTSPPPGIGNVQWLKNGAVNSADRWLASGSDLGGQFVGGGLIEGYNFFGSAIVSGGEFISVELRFSPTKKQKAYRYLRGASPNYGFQDYSEIPCTIWDIESSPPRQLNAAFVEQRGGPAEDKTWLPTASAGDREYLFIFKSTYTDAPQEKYTKDPFLAAAGNLDILYGWWPLLRSGRTAANLAEGQVLRITANKVNTAADVFEFKTTAPVFDDNALAQKREDLKLIRVVPNPYYGQSAYELSSLARLVRFTRLPKQCMIKVFSLGGDLVRSINHTDGTSIESWDLKTDHGLPVASGVYLAFIEAPGIGKQVVKIAIFMEAERLEAF